MADPLLAVDVDATELLAALDRLGDGAEVVCQEAALETSRVIQREGRARVRRATGRMREAIWYDTAPGPLGGYRVYLLPMSDPDGGMRPENFGLWHEVGTEKMTAQPFLLISAQMEEGAHLRRVSDAVQDAIDEQGLGDG